ncbi:MAG TPA: hypothetical protein DEP05_06470, partial [Betaproteobacteria bacterium]|nr:hypothetical protein [Betaproteobacteria bacterium]
DHSIRIGDLIAIDNRYGVITRLTGRYVVLKSTDGSDTLIPNETLITSTVINYHYSGREARLALPVQISYASDLDRAMQILRHAAACQPRVLKTPPPQANITGFGDNGVNLEVLAWISDPEREQRDLRSAIYYRIWQDFRRDGIEIPYPQREVRMIGQPSDVTILGEQSYASPEEEISR